jgi:hypothetical protein
MWCDNLRTELTSNTGILQVIRHSTGRLNAAYLKQVITKQKQIRASLAAYFQDGFLLGLFFDTED